MMLLIVLGGEGIVQTLIFRRDGNSSVFVDVFVVIREVHDWNSKLRRSRMMLRCQSRRREGIAAHVGDVVRVAQIQILGLGHQDERLVAHDGAAAGGGRRAADGGRSGDEAPMVARRTTALLVVVFLKRIQLIVFVTANIMIVVLVTTVLLVVVRKERRHLLGRDNTRLWLRLNFSFAILFVVVGIGQEGIERSSDFALSGLLRFAGLDDWFCCRRVIFVGVDELLGFDTIGERRR